MISTYVHGYDRRETQRLQDQAATLIELLHGHTAYAPGTRVLEAGCGVGAQTLTLAANSPEASITSIDISPDSVSSAIAAVSAAGFTNVAVQTADIFDLPFDDAEFDHVFVCFVLEHLANPVGSLQALQRVLKPGGSITVIEGDHGSTFFHPDSLYARQAVQCQVDLQAQANGNALVGRELFPLLVSAGYGEVHVSPRMVYVDASRPELVSGFTKNTFTAMIQGVKQSSVAAGLMTETDFDRGIADLFRTTEPDGVFSYTFFKATAIRAN